MEKFGWEKELSNNSQIQNIEKNFRAWDFDEIIDSLKKWTVSKESFGKWYANKKNAENLWYTLRVNLSNTIDELKEWIPTARTVIKVMLQSVMK